MVDGAPQNELFDLWMVWNPTPSAGKGTAPAMQPAAWLPMMCSGPVSVSGPAAMTRTAASAGMRRPGRRGRLEPPLDNHDGALLSHVLLSAGVAVNGLALDCKRGRSVALDAAISEASIDRDLLRSWLACICTQQ